MRLQILRKFSCSGAPRGRYTNAGRPYGGTYLARQSFIKFPITIVILKSTKKSTNNAFWFQGRSAYPEKSPKRLFSGFVIVSLTRTRLQMHTLIPISF